MRGAAKRPQATGKQCPEGWTLYPFPGPKLQNDARTGSAEASYYAWVDQFNTLGLGANVPIATGNGAEGLLALVDGKFVTCAYPTRSASTSRAWTAASTTRMPAGKAVACGRLTAPAP